MSRCPKRFLTGQASGAFAALPAMKKREGTAFVPFRNLLTARGLNRRLFAAITRELEAKGAIIRKSLPSGSTPRGTIIDAAIIGSAAKGDEEAAWVKHKTRPPAHGYKAHIASEKDTGIIRKAETTPANEADVSIAPSIIPDRPGAVLATRPILRSR
jgi:IS5 family transposase